MATSKYSHQRESIINFLTGRTDHPTADAVYQYLRNDLPTISLGTVYRNLNQMAASGRILRLHVDGKPITTTPAPTHMPTFYVRNAVPCVISI